MIETFFSSIDDDIFTLEYIKKIVLFVIEKNSLFKKFPGYKKYRLKAVQKIREGTIVSNAHVVWKDEWFEKVKTPNALPRKKNNDVCPANIILVRLECVNEITPNMGSWWGFQGYVLSMLIDIKNYEIWDARGEKTN